MLKQTVNE